MQANPNRTMSGPTATSSIKDNLFLIHLDYTVSTKYLGLSWYANANEHVSAVFTFTKTIYWLLFHTVATACSSALAFRQAFGSK